MRKGRLLKPIIALITTLLLCQVFTQKALGTALSIWKPGTLEATHIHTILTSPYGIFAGKFDSRAIFPMPYNGIYKSIDIGNTWNESGLNKKGVTSLTYKNSKLYAATYYTDNTPAGVYSSSDFGNTWTHSGLQYSGLSITSTSKAILFGTAANGLYRSEDDGAAWQQVIGNGFAPGIKALAGYNHYALAASNNNKVYLSENDGESWAEITFLADKTISALFINDKVMLAGTSNNSGMFRSTDKGKTWNKLISWPDKSVQAFAQFKYSLFVSSFSTNYNTFGVFRSDDNGLTWFDISEGLANLNQGFVSLASVFASQNKLFLGFQDQGIFTYEIPKPNSPTVPFLDLPWQYNNFKLDAQKIYSFFDHKYPLLGYCCKNEPEDAKTTTLNFYGSEKPQPYVYYSSHNGMDFSLPFGQKVLAAASGYAKYSFSPLTGNMIKIDHGNGFETWYMHLQGTGLIVSKSEEKRFVNKGDIIGFVGMTGNTTGPHLHFSVIRDKDGNNKFDDFPDGLVDPYGWMPDNKSDPWEEFLWVDTLGTHKGNKSYYLWEKELSGGTSIINKKSTSITSDNINLTIPQNLTEKTGTFDIRSLPFLNFLNFKWVRGLGFLASSYDITGQEIKEFDGEYKMSLDYANLDISNILEDSLLVYRWSENTKGFEPLTSNVNKESKKIIAYTNKTGEFAVFGVEKDTEPPSTTYKIEGNFENSVYTTDVLVTLESSDNQGGLGVENIYYSLDDGINWEKYEGTLNFFEDSDYKIIYKAEDKAQNMEAPKELEFKLRNRGFTKVLRIVNGGFETGTW